MIPVILDTDIGTDIDDTWALAMLLRSPELDLKLVVSDTGDTIYRACLIAKLLERAGRTDVPVGVGIPLEQADKPQAEWVADYRLSAYPGRVYEDGVGAIVDTIMGSPAPVTVIAIGPLANIAAALQREPAIAERARFVGMHGSIRRGYNGKPQPDAEYNVARYPHACQAVFSAPWEITITPLDTCGVILLDGARYRAVRDCDDPLIRALMENYRLWARNAKWAGGVDPEVCSSVLFDTAAVYLAFCEELLVMETLPIRITDDGYTKVEPGARLVRCATEWKDLPAFADLLVQRLTST
ncbi:MAG: nucleoside hydrolase [Anaerolineae bacterium]|nr:nucleoside hydrolase [Anaerolineae bacterium]